MATLLLVSVLVALGFGIWRVLRTGLPRTEKRLYEILLQKAGGDRVLADRLIDYEASAQPGFDPRKGDRKRDLAPGPRPELRWNVRGRPGLSGEVIGDPDCTKVPACAPLGPLASRRLSNQLGRRPGLPGNGPRETSGLGPQNPARPLT